MSDLQEGKTRVVFLHFYDVHFLALKQAHLYEDLVTREARLATRLALLMSSEVLIPAASYFESSICRAVVGELRALFPSGKIWLVGAAANVDEFIFNKLRQYDSSSEQHVQYMACDRNALPPFRSRARSATRDIKADWIQRLHESKGVAAIATGTRFSLPNDFERRWERVPTDLQERAFIVEYVAPLLLGDTSHPTLINRLHSVVNEAYFASYVGEFGAHTFRDMIYLASPHAVPSQGSGIPFRALLDKARNTGILDAILNCDARDLLKLQDDERWIACLCSAVSVGELGIQYCRKASQAKETRSMDALRCFIVHGHDDKAKLELKDYLQSRLGLPEPIVLHQQPSRGMTIIEKFEEHSRDIDVAFVLLTPDDIGGISDNSLMERARQNVIFELGFFVGRFERLSGRIILLHKGELEIPSDLHGVSYIDITNGVESAGEKIRLELEELDRLEEGSR